MIAQELESLTWLREARQKRHEYIAVEHLLLGCSKRTAANCCCLRRDIEAARS
jgi:hypothetical protein